tara:strand:+ start:723 stop:1100 length:378 start_codon:yes stop_codon:yes gene_type:complete
MPMSRQDRVNLHKKQERTQVRSGRPDVSELKEGVPSVRQTGDGVIEFLKHNGTLMQKVLSPSAAIADLTDSTGGTSGGNTIADMTTEPINLAAACAKADAENAVATLVSKINAIIKVLREQGLIQ